MEVTDLLCDFSRLFDLPATQICSAAVAVLIKMSCDGKEEVVVGTRDGVVGKEVDELITLKDASGK